MANIILKEHLDRLDPDKEIKFQTLQQNLVKKTYIQKKISFEQQIETVRFYQPLETKYCQKAISTSFKVIAFTDTTVKPLFSHFLYDFLGSTDIDWTEYHNEESFIESINQDHSITYFVLIKSSQNIRHLIDLIHVHANVHSIYLQCEPTELKFQERLARHYSRLNGVFDDSLRLMVALIMDMALFCEETADRQRDQASSMKMVQQNYQRSIDLYRLIERLV